jgi:prevent-host-death family protein
MDTITTTTITLEDAETRLAELATRVEQGETIVITRDGKPVLDLVPHKRKGGIDWEGGRRYLAERGVTKLVEYIAPDFDEPLPEDFLLRPLPGPEPKPQ